MIRGKTCNQNYENNFSFTSPAKILYSLLKPDGSLTDDEDESEEENWDKEDSEDSEESYEDHENVADSKYEEAETDTEDSEEKLYPSEAEDEESLFMYQI